MPDITISLSDVEYFALQKICAEIGEKTGKTPPIQQIIDEQVFYYIKKMLLSHMPVDIPGDTLEGYSDIQQAEILARFKMDLPNILKELAEEAVVPTRWQSLKDYLSNLLPGG